MSDFPANVEKTSRAIDTLKAQREAALRATAKGPPARTSNPFFGVGPITNMTADELERNALRFEFEAWVEANYRELDLSMHRGYPADKIVLEMMREIHRYFGFPKRNRMAVGLGGGHNGLTVALLHLMNPRDGSQGVFVDTPRPESMAAAKAGFFRQSWGAQILELQTLCTGGSADRVHFSDV